MDVNNSNFRQLLPDIISSIENSSFGSSFISCCDSYYAFSPLSYFNFLVAIDLELSGIHKTFGPRNAPLNRKQTLEERYQEVKTAAERFQVLQLGLCAVSYDEVLGQLPPQ